MAFVQWDERMSVGVETIDQQHRELLELMNSLHETCSGDACQPDAVQKAADQFSEYTRYHFSTEEQFMDSTSYPEFDEHMEQHMECSMKAADFFGDYLAGGGEVGRDMLEYLKQWLINHILKTDRKLGLHLRNQGLE
ncbi:bacteriohemerythrin [Desulfovibrio ferrophilus]|uniref:Methyl-accepting chemotaxis protein n=1 Tax=Desulfovibrio ferrophilus TaxID=241368 RepID=A0A2Z6AUA5_9BACT|nr:bacteriohemerythrin [Desulfovibrio ferrophilus]BBD06766.1 methyl-accepting chemotaxis protein [Desulfovibrio ferrophilus]